MSLSPSLPLALLFNDDDVNGALAAANWPLKVRSVAIEFRDVFDNVYGGSGGGGCSRASKPLLERAADIVNSDATEVPRSARVFWKFP